VTKRLRDALASLTSRLVLTTVALVLLVTVAVGAATTVAMRSYLTERLDDQLTRTMGRLAEAVEHGGPGPGLGDEVGTIVVALPSDGTPVGNVVVEHEAGPADTRKLPSTALEGLDRIPADQDGHDQRVDGLGGYRLMARDFGNGTLVVGLPATGVDDTIDKLLAVEALLALLAVTVAGGAALVVVRRQLRPLREVAATAHAVAQRPLATGEVDLAERVSDHLIDERTEVGRVGAALNTLLAHVETSLAARHRSEQQVRQFVADASHELRSPLATIAGYTELARARPGDAGATATALDKVEEESGRMTTLVEDLLLLARLDSGRPLERQPVDLVRLVVEGVSDAQVVAPDHQWRVDVPEDAVEHPYEVPGDEPRLHQVLTNLLTNARKHTPAGTTVSVRVRRDGFSVHDDGPGFPPGLVDHAFERFARGDEARTRGDEVGVGLGLALVEAIVAAHGGRVSLASVPGDTTVDVTLPTG
jgi:two-component system OmpR family sensor kinase